MCSSWCFCLLSVTCCLPSLQHLVNLFARLSNDNIGYVDWDPYIPKVCFFFSALHHLLHVLVLVCFEIWGTRCHVWPDDLLCYCLTVCISWPLLCLRETHYQVSLLISLLVTEGKWLASWLFWFMFFWHHHHVILINKHTVLTCLVRYHGPLISVTTN